MLKRILTLNFLPSSTDAGLLALRICAFGSLFIKHGYEKIFTFSEMAARMPDPLHLGKTPTLIFAMTGDGICTLLIIIGLATRLAALYEFTIVFVAWAFMHHFMFLGHGADHGEVIWLYISALIALFIAGPGRYSLDALLNREPADDRQVPVRHSAVSQQ
jgi:putative oxidoreductase